MSRSRAYSRGDGGKSPQTRVEPRRLAQLTSTQFGDITAAASLRYAASVPTAPQRCKHTSTVSTPLPALDVTSLNNFLNNNFCNTNNFFSRNQRRSNLSYANAMANENRSNSAHDLQDVNTGSANQHEHSVNNNKLELSLSVRLECKPRLRNVTEYDKPCGEEALQARPIGRDPRGKSEQDGSAKPKEKPRRSTKSPQWRVKTDGSESGSQSDQDRFPGRRPGRTSSQRRRRRACTPDDRADSDQSDEDASRDRQSRRRSGQNSSLTVWQTSKILQGWQISFDGENREEARAFLASLKECQESNEIPTDRLLRSMPVVLKDKAKRWFRENKHRWTTWTSFRKAFKDKYMKLLRDSEVRSDLDRRTQAKGETISDFADCFRYLVRHLRRKPDESPKKPNWSRCSCTTCKASTGDISLLTSPGRLTSL
ncbi:unnamed protein product [Trichogramma brassicae]|uniref:Retrotransposon gag domain-containing protein n=1 Tax=Trichogramma brassicae TaxID=86971 RepID=A0A6H5I6M3_9HYME|nr:unnamed protein product [Trichogramma brassicae]